MKKIWSIFILILLFTSELALAQVVETSTGSKVIQTNNQSLQVSVSPSTYTGQVATSTAIPNATANVGFFLTQVTRKAHYARVPITALQLVYANWWVSIANNVLGAEVANGNALTVSASIEYPVGVFTAVKFSGGSSVSIPDFTTIVSDSTSVTIPAGAKFYTRTLDVPTTGFNIPQISSFTYPGSVLFYNGAGADEASYYGGAPPALNGTITDNQTGETAYYPAAIIGTTSQPSFCLLGDSRVKGIYDNADSTYDIGDLARSVGPSYAYINLGIGSDRPDAFFWGGALRTSLMQYCNVFLDQYGFNDFGEQSGSPAATVNAVEAYKKTLAARFNGKKYSLTTLEPSSTSSDSFATAGNQTTSSFNTNLTTYNQWARTSPEGIPYSDISAPVSTSLDSGKWAVNGFPKHNTPDGVHETINGNLLIQNSGNINANTLANSVVVSTSYPSMTLTAIGSPTFGAGNFGQALLTGAQGYMDGIVPGIPPITIEAWINTSSTAATQFIASSGPIAIEVQASTGYICFYSGFSSTCSTTVVTDGTWHDIEVDLHQPTGGIAVYVDGISAVTGTISRDLTGWNNCTQSFGVGYNAILANTGTTPFLGSIDEVSIWSTERHTGNFTPPVAPYVGNEAGLVGLWHFDGNLNGIRGPTGM